MESAVISITLDGVFKTDLVLYRGGDQFQYNVLLGPVSSGLHVPAAAFNRAKSSTNVTGASIGALNLQIVSSGDPNYDVIRFAPILYGRNYFAPFENNHTDTPEIVYYTKVVDGTGATTLEYTVIFSNEDGGSGSNQDIGPLLARWGRSTDIEWLYRVKIDSRRQLKSEVYQGDSHSTVNFTGLKEGAHPLLYTRTTYNTFGQVTDPNAGYRFFINPVDTLPANRAREQVMDQHPESYRLMADEAIREGAIKDTAGNPADKAVSDLRNYCYIELDKTTTYVTPPASGAWVGLAVAVQLKGDGNWYTSHHGDAGWSIQRDGPAATTTELPGLARTATLSQTFTSDMVQAIKVFPVPYNSPPSDYSVKFNAINRAFFLDANFGPKASFLSQSFAGVTLTAANETDGVIVWTAGP